MKTLSCSFLLAAIALAGSSSLLAADAVKAPGLPAYKQRAPFTGELTAHVPTQINRLAAAWVAAFQKLNPDAKITIESKETSYRTGAIGLGDGTDEIYEASYERYIQTYNYDPFRVIVSMGGVDKPGIPQAVAVFVNKDNPVKQLTVAQVDAIYSSTRKRGASAAITTWGQLGASGDWASRPIHPFMTQYKKDTAWFFRDHALLGGLFKASCMVPASGLAADVVAAVASDPDAIGFGGAGSVSDGVHTLALGHSEKAYGSPTDEEVAAGEYPLSSSLEIYVNRKPGTALAPLTKAFIAFVMSQDGQDILAADTTDHFAPIPPKVYKTFRGQLENPPL